MRGRASRLAGALAARARAWPRLVAPGDEAYTIAKASFAGDGLITRHYVGRMSDEPFAAAMNAAFTDVPSQPFHQHLGWRIHIATWAASQAISQAPGALVECGVWYGFLSRAICDYVNIDATGRDFYLVDMWGGETDHHDEYPDDIYAEVKARFATYSRVHLIRGRVPNVLDQLRDVENIAYMSLDMNDRDADVAALEWGWDRLSPGAIVYFDDWGWEYPHLRKRLADFLEDKSERLLHFPSGNSILVRAGK